MPVDLWDTGTWLSPSPEADVRARVQSRTRVLRRRRTVPVVLTAVVAVAALSTWPRASEPVGVATTGPDATMDASAPEQPTTPGPAAGVTATPAPAPPAPTPSPKERARSDSGSSHSPTELVPPKFPATPNPSATHPLLEDAQGDATVETAPGQTAPDPTVDITHVDVTADQTSVTGEVAVLDLGGTSPPAFGHGAPTARRYTVRLRRHDGYFVLTAQRSSSGATSFDGSFWTTPETRGFNGPIGFSVVGVTGSFDVSGGTARVTATFQSMNDAMAQDARDHDAMGIGTVVVPEGSTTSIHGTSATTVDLAYSDDDSFAYRLGD